MRSIKNVLKRIFKSNVNNKKNVTENINSVIIGSNSFNSGSSVVFSNGINFSNNNIVGGRTINISGDYIEKELDISNKELDSIHSINNTGFLNVFFYPSDSNIPKVMYEGCEDLIDYLDVYIEEGVMKISLKENYIYNINSNKGISIKVYSNNVIHNILMNGAGGISFEGALGDNNEVTVNGSGDILLNSRNTNDIKNLKTKVVGSGDIILRKITEGSINVYEGEIIGSGDIVFNGKFQLESSTLLLSGSGDISIINSGKTKCKINGSGDIVLKGNYSLENKEINGSGGIEEV